MGQKLFISYPQIVSSKSIRLPQGNVDTKDKFTNGPIQQIGAPMAREGGREGGGGREREGRNTDTAFIKQIFHGESSA